MRMNNIFSMMILAVSMVLGLSGCGGGSSSDSNNNNIATTNKVVAAVYIIDGNSQSAAVATELPNALVALIKNSEGQPIAGQTVNFVVTSGGGTVFAPAATSDSSGYVRQRWTLGTVAGVQKVEVRAVDSNGNAVVFETFLATAVASTPQTLRISSGNNQSAQQLTSLPSPVTVLIKDSYGNPVAGVTVVFSANNSGNVTPTSSNTNASGEASATWTLGQQIGSQTLIATVTGLPQVTFNAYADQAPAGAAKTLAKVSGDLQTVTQHSSMSGFLYYGGMVGQTPTSTIPLVVQVTDTLGNPVPNTLVTFSSSTGSGYVIPTTVSTDSSGKASWTGYIHTAGQQMIDASVAGLPSVTFTTNVTATTHTYDGKYNCTSIKYTTTSLTGTSGTLAIIDGKCKNGPYMIIHTSFDETTGVYSGYTGTSLSLHEFARIQLTVDSLQRATGSGTFGLGYSGETTGGGTWSCTRE